MPGLQKRSRAKAGQNTSSERLAGSEGLVWDVTLDTRKGKRTLKIRRRWIARIIEETRRELRQEAVKGEFRAYMELKGWTQRQLATYLGLREWTISRLLKDGYVEKWTAGKLDDYLIAIGSSLAKITPAPRVVAVRDMRKVNPYVNKALGEECFEESQVQRIADLVYDLKLELPENPESLEAWTHEVEDRLTRKLGSGDELARSIMQELGVDLKQVLDRAALWQQLRKVYGYPLAVMYLVLQRVCEGEASTATDRDLAIVRSVDDHRERTDRPSDQAGQSGSKASDDEHAELTSRARYVESALCRYPEALSAWTEAINSRPENSYSYFRRGAVLIRLRQSQSAIRDFTTAISLGAAPGPNYLCRGAAYQEIGNHAEAIADFTTVVEESDAHEFYQYVAWKRREISYLQEHGHDPGAVKQGFRRGDGCSARARDDTDLLTVLGVLGELDRLQLLDSVSTEPVLPALGSAPDLR